MLNFKCLLCGKSNGNPELVKHGTRDSDHDVVKCPDCGHVQLYPLPSKKEDAAYYNQNFRDKISSPGLDNNDIYQKFLFQNENRMRYLIQETGLEKKWKCLDYASGYGHFIELMFTGGYTFDGVEISEERLKICMQRSKRFPDSTIYTFNAQEEEVPSELTEKYDLITMFHLLEHLVMPIDLLKKVRKMLKPEGVLVLELPNYANRMMEISREFHDFFFIRDHVSYYTPDTVIIPIKAAGYRNIGISGVQLYGLTNHMNWIINKGPQLTKPSYESCSGMRWIEDIYKAQLEKTVSSEYMKVICYK